MNPENEGFEKVGEVQPTGPEADKTIQAEIDAGYFVLAQYEPGNKVQIWRRKND